MRSELAGSFEGSALLPGNAVVERSVGAAALFGTFHLRVNDARITGRLVEADAAEIAGGETALHLGPGLAGVDGAVERAFRSAVVENVSRRGFLKDMFSAGAFV